MTVIQLALLMRAQGLSFGGGYSQVAKTRVMVPRASSDLQHWMAMEERGWIVWQSSFAGPTGALDHYLEITPKGRLATLENLNKLPIHK